MNLSLLAWGYTTTTSPPSSTASCARQFLGAQDVAGVKVPDQSAGAVFAVWR